VLISYIYDFAGFQKRPVGCVVAHKTNRGNIAIGYSLCNPKDKFNKRIARNLAMKAGLPLIPQRNIEDYSGNIVPMSKAVDRAIEKMLDRIQKYYHNNKATEIKPAVGKWCLFNAYGAEYVGLITKMPEHDWHLVTADFVCLYPNHVNDSFMQGAFHKNEIVEVY